MIHSTKKLSLSNKLSYREATFDDCDILFAWANDPITRKNAHNKEPIQYDAHVEWLKNKLNSFENWIFLVIKDNSPVALLRLDKKGNNALLAYSVAAEHRGKGIGLESIIMLPDIIENEKIPCEKIVAEVYKSNTASIKILQNAGYQKHENDNYYIFTKSIGLKDSHTIVIATTKPWNIKLAKEMESSYERGRVHIITQKKELTISLLDEIRPDYVFFPHWSWIIPSEIFMKHRCIAFHMTDLPFGRGGSPLQNLIARGIKETKISSLRVSDEIDAGDIYIKYPLSLYGTAEEIFLRASKIIFHEMIPHILRESPVPVPQAGEVTRFVRRTPDMNEIKDNMSLEECYDYIRMLDADSYPKAYIQYGKLCFQFSRPKLTSEGIIADVQIREGNSNE